MNKKRKIEIGQDEDIDNLIDKNKSLSNNEKDFKENPKIDITINHKISFKFNVNQILKKINFEFFFYVGKIQII